MAHAQRTRIASGKLEIGCLAQPVDVYWDNWGIPHIFAQTVDDAYRALGFVCAHERLWQMELGRLIATGRACSVFGKRFLWSDATMRTFDVDGARAGFRSCGGDAVVAAYFEGVNAYVDRLDARPPEFVSADTDPRHFTLADAAIRHRHLTWFQYHCWMEKIVFAKLAATHGTEYWAPSVGGISAEDAALLEAHRDVYRALDPSVIRLVQPEMAGGGSNNWAIGASHSASGKPIVASDPHLPLGIPTVFFNAHMEAPGFSLTGACFPDMGTFPIGHSRRHAWCITTGRFDNYDLFLEELDPNDPERYRTKDGFARMETRTVDIEVKGEAPYKLDIKRTQHGPTFEPLMRALGHWKSQAEQPRSHAMALRWSIGETATTAGALARLPQARTAAEFAEYVYDGGLTSTVFNMLYADTDGRLQRFAATHMPKRQGVTGKVPLPGWTGGYEFPLATPAELRLEHDPARDFLATANHDTQIPSLGQKHDFAIHNYPLPDTRAARVFEELASRPTHTLHQSKRLQTDVLDVDARDTVPALLEALGEPQSERQRTGVALLRAWDYRASQNSAAACVHYVLDALQWAERTAVRVLEADGHDGSFARLVRMNRTMGHLLHRDVLFNAKAPWAKRRDLLRDTLRDLMDRAVEFCEKQMGPDPANWQWGRIHTVRIQHALASQETFREHHVGPDPWGGSGHTVGVAPYVGRGPYHVHLSAVIRMQVDLARPDESEWVISTGNSGRHDSVHTTDLYPLWLSGDYVTLRRERGDVAAHAEAHWALR